jgi:hypothetical protein
LAVLGVAIVIAIDEMRSDLSQIAFFDRLIAHHAGRLRTGLPAVHQDESHAMPPDTKQNAGSAGRETWGGVSKQSNHLRSPSWRVLKRSAHLFEQSAVRQE